VTAVESFEPGLDHGNFFVDLTDRQTEVEARSRFETDDQPLTVHPEIFQRAAVVLAKHRRPRFDRSLSMLSP
jgi:hypothetical protein